MQAHPSWNAPIQLDAHAPGLSLRRSTSQPLQHLCLLAIYSRQAESDSFTIFSARTSAHHKAGESIKVKAEQQDRQAVSVIDRVSTGTTRDDQPPPQSDELDRRVRCSRCCAGVTVDMWVLRAA
ncbi:hypothetical protein [Roseateles violae]|uniref:Uncharacterized protein n=1 Tax=Roseateles violae TaxID=3058042 RepID=A0ABT8DSI5_9BURK|nr:hypothetical protein [Pelomonas sp. PFR6]MDN3919111.1 hypothetical protein [Pelomonas sp. PFR6]